MPVRSAILLGATIAQVGEFSFLIAASRRCTSSILDARAYNLVLATAVLSIVVTPLLVQGAHRLVLRLEHARSARPGGTGRGGGAGDARRAGRGGRRRAAVGRRARRGPGGPGRDPGRARPRLSLRGRGPRPAAARRGRGPRCRDAVRRRGEPGDPRPLRPGPGAAARGGRGRPADRAPGGGAGARDQPAARHRGARPRDPRDPAAARRRASAGSRTRSWRPRWSSPGRRSTGWASRDPSRRRCSAACGGGPTATSRRGDPRRPAAPQARPRMPHRTPRPGPSRSRRRPTSRADRGRPA